MLKRLIFCLWILLPFSLFAQNEEESSTAHDSLSTEKHQGAFMKAIKKFLNFNDFDTTYISPNRYNYALMLDHFHKLRILLRRYRRPRAPTAPLHPQPSQQDRGLLWLALDIF